MRDGTNKASQAAIELWSYATHHAGSTRPATHVFDQLPNVVQKMTGNESIFLQSMETDSLPQQRKYFYSAWAVEVMNLTVCCI